MDLQHQRVICLRLSGCSPSSCPRFASKPINHEGASSRRCELGVIRDMHRMKQGIFSIHLICGPGLLEMLSRLAPEVARGAISVFIRRDICPLNLETDEQQDFARSLPSLAGCKMTCCWTSPPQQAGLVRLYKATLIIKMGCLLSCKLGIANPCPEII